MFISILLASTITITPPSVDSLPSKYDIEMLNVKALDRVKELKRQSERCGATLVVEQVVWGINAPLGSKLCQNAITKKFRLIFPKPQLINNVYVSDYQF